MSDCTQSQDQPLLNRICPVSDCLEWHVAQWHGVGFYVLIKFMMNYSF